MRKITGCDTCFFVQPSAYCQVIAKRFSDQKNWYFKRCTGCDLELENVGEKFVCLQKNGCGRTIPYPDKRSVHNIVHLKFLFSILMLKIQLLNYRFRLCIFCSDDTGSLAIVFPDDEISRIIDKTVIDLHTDCANVKFSFTTNYIPIICYTHSTTVILYSIFRKKMKTNFLKS